MHSIDIAIVIAYLVTIVVAGLMISKRAQGNIQSYFLGGNRIPWYFLGIANASGMYDITGTMWMVMLFFVYGIRSAFIPWLWPHFNQIFLMIYLAAWLRRSNVMTGAEWIKTRFGRNSLGSELSHISVVIYALVNVIGFLAYAFQGIGKFSAIFFPWDLSPNIYAVIFMSITAVYLILGGMYSVVITDIIQYAILTVSGFIIAGIAIARTSPDMIHAVIPAGWKSVWFGWHLDLNWTGLVDVVNNQITSDGYNLFGIFIMMVLFKGLLNSMAGPAPNYDMQKILSARTAKEASLISFSTTAVLLFPRYLLIAGIGVLGLVFYSSEINSIAAAGGAVDLEQILPQVIYQFLPAGVTGLVLAGLLAAFMSTFDGTVNAGASYIVNDIYKRYIRPDAPEKRYVYVSYFVSLLVVIVGFVFGFMVSSIDSVLQWIVSGLYGGYIAPNLLKWHWWRFNSYGYFAGMISGTGAALLFIRLFPDVNDLSMFPYILLISAVFSVVASLITPADNEETLKGFYRQVRPWGFWKPIHDKVVREHPDFKRNTAFGRDMTNVVVGIIWQIPMIIIPMYIIIREYAAMGYALVVLAITSIILKKNWYDKLEEN